jgi:hypothetical protein
MCCELQHSVDEEGLTVAYALIAGTGPYNVDLTTKGKRVMSWSVAHTAGAAGVINFRNGGLSGEILARINLGISTSASQRYWRPQYWCFPKGLFVEVTSATTIQGSVDLK